MTNTYQLTLADVASHDAAYLETIFSLANGHFGIRASDPIQASPSAGTIVNGFYEQRPIVYGEAAVGYAKYHQTIVNLPDLRRLTIKTADGHSFDQSQRDETMLDLLTGELTEAFTLSTASGETIQLTLRSVIGQTQNDVGLRYTLTPLTYRGTVTVQKELIPIVTDQDDDDPRKARQVETLTFTPGSAANVTTLMTQTATSGQAITLGIYHKALHHQTLALDSAVTLDYIGKVSLIDQPLEETTRTYDAIQADSRAYWQEVWNRSQIEIGDEPRLSQAIHYNVFQLNQSAGRDGRTNIAAKGLSGTGYEGHYFWDTEMYMLPYFIYSQPHIARQLLAYRYSILPQAKRRARELGVDRGALFAWRTINGEEASAYYPAGTAQYHIDADIAYAIGTYLNATQDDEFLNAIGFEMLLETARFWVGFGSFHEVNGEHRFEFFDVTGPDEYTAIVNNNYYTNRMAKHNLGLVLSLVERVDQTVLDRLAVSEAELQDMADIQAHIYLPYNQEHQINAQDDSFFDKPVWPFDTTPKANYPLLLHYHPLTIYRHQVAKQADTILAEYLFPEDVDTAQLQREYDYYEHVTTHDSSLSRSIFSMVAARLGRTDEAYRYFMDTAQMDLVDLQGNASDGLHLANLGGSWLALVTGFSGMRVIDGQLQFEPHLPAVWPSVTFRMVFQDRLLEVLLTHDAPQVTLLQGDPLMILVDGKPQSLEIIK